MLTQLIKDPTGAYIPDPILGIPQSWKSTETHIRRSCKHLYRRGNQTSCDRIVFNIHRDSQSELRNMYMAVGCLFIYVKPFYNLTKPG